MFASGQYRTASRSIGSDGAAYIFSQEDNIGGELQAVRQSSRKDHEIRLSARRLHGEADVYACVRICKQNCQWGATKAWLDFSDPAVQDLSSF